MSGVLLVLSALSAGVMWAGVAHADESGLATAPGGDGWLLKGMGSLPARSEPVVWGNPDDDNYFSAVVTIAPRISVDGNLVAFDFSTLKSEDVQKKGPCGNCLALGFRLFTQSWSTYVSQRVSQVRIGFDRGVVTGDRGEAARGLKIPDGAALLTRIEIDLEGEGLKKTFTWDAPAASDGSQDRFSSAKADDRP
jgi:hypothetical protein